jgi:hypothetical protein
VRRSHILAVRCAGTLRRGYTIMEVMAAMACLTISAMGIVALQKVAVIGNRNARNLATANQVGSSWLERLRYDGAHWTSTATLSNTRFLKLVDTGWQVPNQGAAEGLGSARADVLGVDLYPGDTAAVGYCTHIRLTTMGNPGDIPPPSLLRAEVRVFWARDGGPVPAADCDDPAAITVPSAKYGMAMYTTGIERSPSIQ